MSEIQRERLNWQALFADETSDYRMPEEPDAGMWVRLRFRTAKGNADRVFYIEDEDEGGDRDEEGFVGSAV